MAPGSLTVEFLGVPGVGKSALSRRVAVLLGELGVPVHEPSRVLAHDLGLAQRRLRKAAIVARECLLHPAAALRASRALSATGQPSAGVRRRLAFNWLLVGGLLRRARSGAGVQLFDQGLLQAAWSLALEGRQAGALALLQQVDRALLPDVVVVVEASRAAVAQRLEARPTADSRLDRALPQVHDLLARGEELVRSIRELVAAWPAVRLLAVSNETQAELEAGARRVTAALAAAAGITAGPIPRQ